MEICKNCGLPVEYCTCGIGDDKSNVSPGNYTPPAGVPQRQKFCTKCGKPTDQCTCNKEPRQAPGFCTRCGNPIDQCTCNMGRLQRNGAFCTKCGRPIAECACEKYDHRTMITFSDLLGFKESNNYSKEDIFEVGKNIVPDIIDPCKEEVPIKQYEVGRIRERLSLSWGYDRIQITNKRIINRIVRKSPLGKDVTYQEYAIDELAGLSFAKGRQFSFGDFLLVLFLMIVTGAIGWGISLIFRNNIFGIIMSCIAILACICLNAFLHKKSNVVFALMFGFTLGCSLYIDPYYLLYYYESMVLPIVLMIVTLIFAVVYLNKSALLPSITIKVKCRYASGDGINTKGTGSRRVTDTVSDTVVLLSKDTELFMKEAGAIINDIQKYGDYAISKWKK